MSKKHAEDKPFEELIKEVPDSKLEAMLQIQLAEVARNLDSPKGFWAYFLLMHGTELHSEGMKWIENAYKAHEEGRGDLQECHRESGKTTVFSKFFTSFRIGHEPHKINAVIRINDEKANETTAGIAHIIENDPKWKLVFPHVVPDKGRGWGANGYFVKRTNIPEQEWAEILTKQPDGPTLKGYGWTSGSIIGSRFNGVIIVDDIHDRDNTRSDRQLNEVKGFYKDTLQYCIMKGAWEIWNYTPWLMNDLYAYVASLGMYNHNKTPVMTPAEEGEEGAQYWENEPDVPISGKWWKLYWPEVWDFKRIGQKYRMTGAIDFARMMLLDLTALQGVNLKAEWLHKYPNREIGPSWPVVFGIDYASTQDKLKDKDRDYFALSIYSCIPGGGIVLKDGYRAKISKGEALDTVMTLWGMYPSLVKIGVETHGKGEEFYSDLMLLNDMNGRIPPLMPIQHGRKGKGERFQDWLAPRFQASRIWISDAETSFLNAFRDEWLLWPDVQHDDCLDAAYMGALAAEGNMPSMAERTAYNSERKTNNPFTRAGTW